MSGIAFYAYNIDGKIYLEFVVENKDIYYIITDKKENDVKNDTVIFKSEDN